MRRRGPPSGHPPSVQEPSPVNTQRSRRVQRQKRNSAERL
ncbi:hypothetical protein [Azospirillum largimobile]